jgi:hypothetical protein
MVCKYQERKLLWRLGVGNGIILKLYLAKMCVRVK